MNKIEKLQLIKKRAFEQQTNNLNDDDFMIYYHVMKLEAYKRGVENVY